MRPMIPCPYCGKKMGQHRNPATIPLSPRRRKIFDLVAQSGAKGIARTELKEQLFPASTDTTMRTVIHYLNKEIAPSKIYMKGGQVILARSY